jgi:hypothetical protein
MVTQKSGASNVDQLPDQSSLGSWELRPKLQVFVQYSCVVLDGAFGGDS